MKREMFCNDCGLKHIATASAKYEARKMNTQEGVWIAVDRKDGARLTLSLGYSVDEFDCDDCGTPIQTSDKAFCRSLWLPDSEQHMPGAQKWEADFISKQNPFETALENL